MVLLFGLLTNIQRAPPLPPSNPITEWIGYTAGFLTTIAFLPQLITTWKTGGRGLSWGMLALFGTGVVLWIIYGVIQSSWPLTLANIVTLLQVLVIAILKIQAALRAGE